MPDAVTGPAPLVVSRYKKPFAIRLIYAGLPHPPLGTTGLKPAVP
jgi:hypothetical protein